MRLKNKIAIVVGAGQTPGVTMGNGRATAIRFAQEGAEVLLIDKDVDSAEETHAMIEKEGGKATVFRADITVEDDCRAIVDNCMKRYGRIDILHNNVGITNNVFLSQGMNDVTGDTAGEKPSGVRNNTPHRCLIECRLFSGLRQERLNFLFTFPGPVGIPTPRKHRFSNIHGVPLLLLRVWYLCAYHTDIQQAIITGFSRSYAIFNNLPFSIDDLGYIQDIIR